MTNPINEFSDDKRTDQIYKVGKLQANVRSGYGVLNSIIGGILFILIGLFFLLIAKVYFIGLILIAAGVLIPIGTSYNRKKEMRALSEEPTTTVSQSIPVMSDEVMMDYVAGVVGVGTHAATFVIGSAGVMSAPENCIVRTNKNIWFVYVPMPGSDVITEHIGMGIAQFDYLLGQKDIEEKLKSLIANGGLNAVINSSQKNFAIPLNELKNVRFNLMGNVVFEKADGQKFSYGVGGGKNKEKIQKLFQDKLNQ